MRLLSKVTKLLLQIQMPFLYLEGLYIIITFPLSHPKNNAYSQKKIVFSHKVNTDIIIHN